MRVAMEYPESLCAIIRSAAEKHRGDIDAAVNQAFGDWQESDEYADWVDEMVRGQIRNMIHDVRHADNVTIRRNAGDFGGPSKVGVSAANQVIEKSLLDTYSINGRRLGDILGKELSAIANGERERATGCIVNARLLEALKPLVSDDKSVRQCVKDKKAWQILRTIKRSVGGQAA